MAKTSFTFQRSETYKTYDEALKSIIAFETIMMYHKSQKPFATQIIQEDENEYVVETLILKEDEYESSDYQGREEEAFQILARVSEALSQADG